MIYKNFANGDWSAESNNVLIQSLKESARKGKTHEAQTLAKSLEDLAFQNGYDRSIKTYELDAQNKTLSS